MPPLLHPARLVYHQSMQRAGQDISKTKQIIKNIITTCVDGSHNVAHVRKRVAAFGGRPFVGRWDWHPAPMIQCISVCPGGIANHTLMLPNLVPKLILNQPRPCPKTNETNYLWSPRVVVLCLFWNPWVTVDTMLVSFWNPGAPLGFSGRPWESGATQNYVFVLFLSSFYW